MVFRESVRRPHQYLTGFDAIGFRVNGSVGSVRACCGFLRQIYRAMGGAVCVREESGKAG